MTCHDARELMLDADADALRARSGSPLAEHLAGCAACARAADAILAQHTSLDYALRKLADANAEAEPPMRRPRRWLHAALIVPLAAAAALVVFVRDARTPMPVEPFRIEVPQTVVVNAGGPDGVAVMQTRNPNITVVWNF